MTSHPILIDLPKLSNFCGNPNSKRRPIGPQFLPSINCFSTQSKTKVWFLHKNRWTMRCSLYRRSFLGAKGFEKDGILMRKEGKERLVVVRANRGFGFNDGGGDWDKSNTTRVLGNLALAVGLTYLTVTGQLGWLLDAIVSIWLLAVLLPVVGLGAFFWFAGRDIIQSSCPNCGNDFQIFKSSLEDGLQLCPFCTQPFSVQGNKFVRESARFSSGRPTTSGQVFNGFSPRSDKGKASSTTIVDIEAEVKDID